MSTQILTREKAERLARDWFAKVDVLDVVGTMSLCDEDTIVSFGNTLGTKGGAELEKLFVEWYKHFDSMHHDIRNISIDFDQNTIFVDSMVGYYLKANTDTSPVVIPAMSVMKMGPPGEGGELKFKDFRVYFDCSPVLEKIKAVHSKE